MQEEQDHRHTHRSGNGRPDESPLPAGEPHDESYEDERYGLTQVVAGAEKSVIGAALFEGIPPRQRDDRRGGAHRLAPAVDAP